MPHALLALDFGTQSVRAVLFDARGHTLARVQHPLRRPDAPRPGWAELDAGYLWRALADACRALWREPGADPRAVAAVGLATQRNTVLCLDDDGRPLRPAILWLDQRRATTLPPLAPHWRAAMALAGQRATVAQLRAQARSNWLHQHEPGLWARTASYIFLSGYLTRRLTGRDADAVGCQVGYVPFDYARQRWAAPHDWRWRALDIAPRQLPELVPVGGTIGTITRAAAVDTGIPAGTPLVAAASDKACEALGVGALEAHVAALSFGTTATVNVVHPRWVTPVPLLPAYPAALPGHFSAEVQLARGFWLVRWFRDELGQAEVARARVLGVEPESLFDDLVRAVPPGSDGLLLQPYWSPGVRTPGPEARGAVIGFADGHTRAHLYRALLEGLAFGLREGLERLERRGRTPVLELRVGGGGSRSDAAMQLTADVFGRPAQRTAGPDAAALGAAMVAAAGIGLHADVAAAARAMARPGDRFVPDARTARHYARIYEEVYRRLYGRLRPLYARLRALGASD